jgi:nucleotide-binding universal stress UspA family protein
MYKYPISMSVLSSLLPTAGSAGQDVRQKRVRCGLQEQDKLWMRMEAAMYKKILVPLDGSKLAECSLNHVRRFAKNGLVGEVVLLNTVVVEIPWGAGKEEGTHAATFDYAALKKTFMDRSKAYLARLQSQLASEGVKTTTETIESNSPSHTILDYAQNNGADLIVIATHGYTGMKKMLLGSVALKVLHESNVPVLLIRPEECRV